MQLLCKWDDLTNEALIISTPSSWWCAVFLREECNIRRFSTSEHVEEYENILIFYLWYQSQAKKLLITRDRPISALLFRINRMIKASYMPSAPEEIWRCTLGGFSHFLDGTSYFKIVIFIWDSEYFKTGSDSSELEMVLLLILLRADAWTLAFKKFCCNKTSPPKSPWKLYCSLRLWAVGLLLNAFPSLLSSHTSWKVGTLPVFHEPGAPWGYHNQSFGMSITNIVLSKMWAGLPT